MRSLFLGSKIRFVPLLLSSSRTSVASPTLGPPYIYKSVFLSAQELPQGRHCVLHLSQALACTTLLSGSQYVLVV